MKAFDYSLVKDPQYFCDNRMEAHSDHVYYRNGNEMQAAVQDGTETDLIFLNSFKTAPTDNDLDSFIVLLSSSFFI